MQSLERKGYAVNVPLWDELNRFGQNRLLQSSYIWLFLVPMTAKLLSAVSDPLVLGGISEGLRLHLTLPFSWQLFYLSAVFVSVAGAIYAFLCPLLVRKFTTFAAFRSEGRGFEYLKDYAKQRSMKVDLEDFEGGWESAILDGEIEEAERAMAMGRPNTGDPTYRLAKLFWQIHKEENATRHSWRLLCALMYWAGLILIVAVLIENAIYVARTWLPSLMA